MLTLRARALCKRTGTALACLPGIPCTTTTLQSLWCQRATTKLMLPAWAWAFAEKVLQEHASSLMNKLHCEWTSVLWVPCSSRVSFLLTAVRAFSISMILSSRLYFQPAVAKLHINYHTPSTLEMKILRLGASSFMYLDLQTSNDSPAW